jgi:hypothetical protein
MNVPTERYLGDKGCIHQERAELSAGQVIILGTNGSGNMDHCLCCV